MDRKRAEAPERFREEFAFDLTPDITDGGCSTFHRRFQSLRPSAAPTWSRPFVPLRPPRQESAPRASEWENPVETE